MRKEGAINGCRFCKNREYNFNKSLSNAEFEKLSDVSLNKHKEIMFFNLVINGKEKAGLSLDIKTACSWNTVKYFRSLI